MILKLIPSSRFDFLVIGGAIIGTSIESFVDASGMFLNYIF